MVVEKQAGGENRMFQVKTFDNLGKLSSMMSSGFQPFCERRLHECALCHFNYDSSFQVKKWILQTKVNLHFMSKEHREGREWTIKQCSGDKYCKCLLYSPAQFFEDN